MCALFAGLFGDFVIGTVDDFDLDDSDEARTYTLEREDIAGKFVS